MSDGVPQAAEPLVLTNLENGVKMAGRLLLLADIRKPGRSVHACKL